MHTMSGNVGHETAQAEVDFAYNHDRVLDCGHSICASCIKEMGGSRSHLACPQCSRRFRFDSPDQVLRTLPTNYALIQFVAMSMGKRSSSSFSVKSHAGIQSSSADSTIVCSTTRKCNFPFISFV